MSAPRFIYNNLVRKGEILAFSTEHPQYPIENIQDDALDAALSWRSRYGTINGIASGNGRFVVTAGVNGKINFNEGGAELTATITAGTYNGQTLAAEIKTQLEAAGALTYTVTYDEATAKFTIAATGNFALLWNTGTNKAIDASGLLGFSDAADDTGADTYTSDVMVIHTSESFDIDFGEASAYDSIAIMGHNLTASAVVTVYGADDSAFTTNVVSDVLTHNNLNIFEFLGAARSKRYSRFEIEDPANPSGYIQISVAVSGSYFEPNRPLGPYADGPIDESETDKSPSNHFYVVQKRDQLENAEYQLVNFNTASADSIKLMQQECGITEALWLCIDSSSPNTSSSWVHFKESTLRDRVTYGTWSWSFSVEEVA